MLTSFVVSVILTTAKFWAFYLTKSSAVFSDALESIVNVFASGFAVYAIALAHEPADQKHPYGHGKVEFFSAAIEGGMVFAAAMMIIVHAVTDLVEGASVHVSIPGIVLLAGTAVVNGVVGLLLIRTGKRKNSLTLEADGKHVLSDVVTTAGVLVALGLVRATGQRWLDAACAIVVALYLVRVAYGLLRTSTAGLMDEQDLGDDAALRALLDRHVTGEKPPKICSYHKLRHRHAGRMHWVDFHVQVPPEMTVKDSHQIACELEYEIESGLGEADATAHVEPCAGCEACGVERAVPAR